MQLADPWARRSCRQISSAAYASRRNQNAAVVIGCGDGWRCETVNGAATVRHVAGAL